MESYALSSDGTGPSGRSGATAVETSAPTADVRKEGPPIRLPSLTGLRFVAALMVFVYHQSLPIPQVRLLSSNATASSFYQAAAPVGPLGVSFFFVLSGFVLTWSARKGDTAARFWRRRFVKIYPNYVVAWVLAMVLFAASATTGLVAAANLLMVQVWVPNFNDYLSVDPPSWSLGVEAVFYALFPLLLFAIQRIDPRRLKFWIGGALLGILATPLIGYLAFSSNPNIPLGDVSNLQYWFVYIFPPMRILDFALGILLARAVMAGRWRNIGMIWSGLLLVGIFILSEYVPFLDMQRSPAMIGIALLIPAAAIADVEGRFTIFRNRTMLWLGNISFAFYLLHYIVIRTTRQHIGSRFYSVPQSVAIMLAELAGTILVASALYVLVERPMVRRWSNPRTRVRVSDPVVS
jgi:peptidoglycan/LPS O-acetylase OafA/YrhL